MTSPSTHDPSFTKLINRALRIIHKRDAREAALARELADLHVERDAIADRVSDETPVEVTRALRAPKGPDQVVALIHDGLLIKAALRPAGRRNPSREAAVWRCMRDTATRREEHW